MSDWKANFLRVTPAPGGWVAIDAVGAIYIPEPDEWIRRFKSMGRNGVCMTCGGTRNLRDDDGITQRCPDCCGAPNEA